MFFADNLTKDHSMKKSIFTAAVLTTILLAGCGGGGSDGGGTGSVVNANYNFDGIWGVKTSNNRITGPCTWTELTEAFIIKDQCRSASVGGVEVSISCNSDTKTMAFSFDLNTKLTGNLTATSPTELSGSGFSSGNGGACTNAYDLKMTLLSR
jgi:hypothetical protein